MFNKLYDKKGFTLIEVIIAISVVTIGVLTIMTFIMVVIKGNKYSERLTTATVIAQDKLENAFRIGHDSLSNDTGSYTAFISYYWTKTVESNTPGTDTKTVTINVYWDPATTTSSHTIALQTVVAK